MQEYISEAVVLRRDVNGDADIRFSLFTKRFGKLAAKGKSARKITSKLSPHLEVGAIALVRFVEKNGLQVVDALKQGSVTRNPADFFLLDTLLPEGESEYVLWDALVRGTFSWKSALALLGWDPKEASCVLCGNTTPIFFEALSQTFFCARCREGYATTISQGRHESNVSTKRERRYYY